MSVDVHGCLDVLMSHNGLDHFYIAFVFAEPGAEGVAENMRGEIREQFRGAVFSLRSICFLLIVV